MILRSRPMSDKDLQRVTECVSDIGHPSIRRRLSPSHLRLIPQINEIAGTEQALKKPSLAFER
jgi:hypothetical protein